MPADPLDQLRLPAAPLAPRREFADRLRRRLVDELAPLLVHTVPEEDTTMTTDTTVAVWCGSENGGRVTSGRSGARMPATEWIAVTSSDSSVVRSGSNPGSRRASIVLPAPGGPVSMRW